MPKRKRSVVWAVGIKRLGVNLILCGFLHFQDEVSFFGERVLPLVRQLEHGLSEYEAAPA
jgi:FMNH2-dependent dimethyl sulfone monooxygenase